MLQGSGPLNLSPEDQKTILSFSEAKFDDQVTMPFSNPAILPRSTVANQDEMHRILLSSVDQASKQRKFKTPEEFHREILKELPKLFATGDFSKVQALVKYIVYINDIRAERGWSAANDYHWLLMGKCQDGVFDFYLGRFYDGECFDQIKEKYSLKIKTKNFNILGASQGQKQLLHCSYHGAGTHKTEDCKKLQQDPSLKGKQAFNFRRR